MSPAKITGVGPTHYLKEGDVLCTNLGYHVKGTEDGFLIKSDDPGVQDVVSNATVEEGEGQIFWSDGVIYLEPVSTLAMRVELKRAEEEVRRQEMDHSQSRRK